MSESSPPPPFAELIESWKTIPAFLRDDRLEVIAANSLARALSPSFQPGVNLARFVFYSPTPEAHAADWQEMSGQVVSVLRGEAERHFDDPDIRRLVGELASKNSHFADVWATDRRPPSPSAPLDFEHDGVGQLRMWYQQLPVSNDGLVLVVWHPADPSSADALSRLVAGPQGGR